MRSSFFLVFFFGFFVIFIFLNNDSLESSVDFVFSNLNLLWAYLGIFECILIMKNQTSFFFVLFFHWKGS